MAYEVFEKKWLIHTTPKVIIRKNGVVWMNVACIRTWFSESREVVLFFDKEQRKLGIKPAAGSSNNLFSISNGGVSCISLFRKMGIVPLKKVCIPKWNDKEGFVEISI